MNRIAEDFYHSFYNKEWLGDTASVTNLTIDEAYEVQDLVAHKRILLGERVVGYKVGCTSEAIRAQFDLKEPINGRLFQPHIFDCNALIDWSDYINCAIEPEMVLTIGKDLKGENLSDDELVRSIAYVSPGIELHNFKFWAAPASIQELICSGGIHAGLIVGDQKIDPTKLLFTNELFSVYKDGVLVTSAPSAEIMGGPLHSLRWLVTFLTGKGLFLKKGSLVIPGSPVELVQIDRDTTVKITIDNVGDVTTMFKRK